jgi:hypothetical protein
MRKGNLFVINKKYTEMYAIDNVIGYAIDSYFTEHDDILYSLVNTDCYQNLIKDFYNTHNVLNKEVKRKMFHFILSTPIARDMERTLSEGANAVKEYFEYYGHQSVLVPHFASNHNCYNYHWHVIVNSVSCTTRNVLQDLYETYNAIINYLNQNTCTEWSWSYKQSDSYT